VKKIIICLLLLQIAIANVYGNMLYERDNLRTRVFFTRSDELGRDVVIKGKIISISASESLPENDISGIAREKTRATIRLFSNEGVKINDILYVIDNNNLVVSKLEVKQFFSNRTFGNMLMGYGNLKLSIEGYRVVQILRDHNAQWAFIHKSNGDKHFRNGRKGEAISEYRKALEMDSESPEARLALGLVYFSDKIYNFAYSELKKSYDNIQRLYDNEDRFTLLSTLAELSYIEAYTNYNTSAIRIRFRNEGIKYSREALKVNDLSADLHFLLGEFYYKTFDRSDGNDKEARDSYLKAVAANPGHSMANLRLAMLYIKHSNLEKGVFYAGKAVEADPDNAEALELLRRHK